MYGIYLDREAKISITAQLCHQLRQKIRSGELKGGTRLPATRKLAQEYGIARNVVIDTYEQLIAEGYLIAQTGSGTFVAEGIADIQGETDTEQREGSLRNSDHVVQTQMPTEENEEMIDFQTGTPDLRYFPRKHWGRYLKEAAEEASIKHYDYDDLKGVAVLRQQIAEYLFRTKGMHADPDQILIVSGTSDGIALIAQLFRSDYSAIYVEDPTIEFIPYIFKQANYRISPVEVDEFGMKLHQFSQFEKDHLIAVTPSHQFPSGSVLSIQRRQHAVKLAVLADTYIIEDDYDSDFRLKGVPIPPLYTLNSDRVIYIGSFSKTLAPSLRLGFLVVPHHLVNGFVHLRLEMSHRTPTIPQIALAHFMRDGRLDRHIHKMKRIYRHRRNLLISSLKQYFGDRIKIRGDKAGMHLLVEFPKHMATIDWNQSTTYGVCVYSVEEECMVKGEHQHQISLGYGTVTEEKIERGVQQLHRFVQDHM